MTQSDIFGRLPAPLAHEILSHVQKEQRASYALALQTLAAQRKFRPVFIERKVPLERHAWMQQQLGRSLNEQLAGNVLGLWLTGPQAPMLAAFLDSLGISHDGKGSIETLPPSPSKEALKTAVDALFAKFPADHVKTYLHAFQVSEPTAWPPLGELLAEDPRLAF
jgi:hypothetical protein